MPVQFEIVLKDDPSNPTRAGRGGGGGAGGGGAQDDVVEAARRRIASQERNQEIKSIVDRFRQQSGTGPQETPFDPVSEARKRIAGQERNAAIKAEMAKLQPQEGGGVGDMLGAGKGAISSLAGSGLFGSGIASIAPILGAAAPIAAFVGAVTAFKAGVAHFVARGEQLAGFSPAISLARANADVATTFREMREAQALGGTISRLTTAQSKFADQWSANTIGMEKWFGDRMADVLEYLTKENVPGRDTFTLDPDEIKRRFDEDQRRKTPEGKAEEAEKQAERLWGLLSDDIDIARPDRDPLDDAARARVGMPVFGNL